MTTLARPTPTADAIEQVLIGGDLSQLTHDQRLSYYNRVCTSLGLNPLTTPFEYIVLNGKLRLYARKDATEQLRKLHGVSVQDVSGHRVEDVYIVTAKAVDRDGRVDVATGAVAISGLKGEALANALMKAETKAKRRVTLSICGLGMLDETELPDDPPPAPVVVDDPPPSPGPIDPPPPDPIPKIVGAITRPQQKRLFAIATEAGWSHTQLKTWLAGQGYASSSEIPIADYDRVVAIVGGGMKDRPEDDRPFSS